VVNIRLKNIQDWLWPGSCLLCAARLPMGKDLCPGCEGSLPRPAATCPVCAGVLGAAADGVACGRCQQRPPAYSRTRAAFAYAAPVNRLIRDLKYHRRLELARVLGSYLAACLKTSPDPLPDVIVPVPLHPSRLRGRGYNQSLEIARPLCRALKIPLDARLARRIRPTVPQTELPRKLRGKNVRDAFRADKDVSGRVVAIVDDVMTSGHTVNALARALKRAGAREVIVWVVARA
jgi:ComF family protein